MGREMGRNGHENKADRHADEHQRQGPAPPATAEFERAKVQMAVSRTIDDETEVADEAEPVLAPEIQAHLGIMLRRMYSELVAEPVPDRLLELLRKLDQSENDK